MSRTLPRARGGMPGKFVSRMTFAAGLAFTTVLPLTKCSAFYPTVRRCQCGREANFGEENLLPGIVSFNERKNGAKVFSPRRSKFYLSYAAVAALRLGVGSASPSQRTLTSFETPGSCMVTP